MVISAFVVVNTGTQRTYAQVECLRALIVIEKVIPKIHAGDEQQLAYCCGKREHIKSGCRHKKEKCLACGKVGHTKWTCRRHLRAAKMA